ncbi:hypothetical protein Tco_0069143 [Tanacetum coccineum]
MVIMKGGRGWFLAVIAPQPNTFFNPSLVNWNWDEVILIPSDDDEPRAEEDIYTSVNTQVHVKNRKRVFALIDESDSDDEPYWSNTFLFKKSMSNEA